MDKDVYIQELLYSSIKKEWSNAIYSNMDGPVIVQSHSQVLLFVALWTTVHQASLSFTISWSLLKFLESMMQSNHLILCRPLLLLPSIFPSIRVFSNGSALCIRWPKYWSLSFSISPSNEHWFPLGLTGLILLSKGLSWVFSSTAVQKETIFQYLKLL